MIAIRFEHIKTVQHDIGNGVTVPKFATTSSNTQVVVKTFNGPQGNLVLFNEYLCYRLALLLDVPMPFSGICLLDNNTDIYNNCVEDNQLGYGFYSTYLNKVVPLVDSIIPLIANKKIFFRILLFDHVIFNSDRNLGNLLVQYYKNNINLYVIDHTHVFINQTIWDSNCLLRAINEKDYRSTTVLERNYNLYRMFFNNLYLSNTTFSDLIIIFKQKVTEEKIKEYISEIPESWRPPQKDLDALVRYILYRIEHLEEICFTIINYINK